MFLAIILISGEETEPNTTKANKCIGSRTQRAETYTLAASDAASGESV